jgi:hypothetical protein
MLRKRLPVMAIGVVAVILFSGCFVLRGFRFSAHKIVKDGKKVVALLSLYPHGRASELQETDRVFIIVEFPNDPATGPEDTNWRVVDPKIFDVHENFGNNPRTLTRDNELRDFILTNDVCSEIQGGAGRVVLFRTQGNVEDNGRIATEALTKLGLKVDSDANADFEERLHFLSGRWDDDGDGIPNGSDGMECTGAVATTLPVKNP